jgi:hypothetical protein
MAAARTTGHAAAKMNQLPGCDKTERVQLNSRTGYHASYNAGSNDPGIEQLSSAQPQFMCTRLCHDFLWQSL